MPATLTLIGNEAVHVSADGLDVYVDAFYSPIPGMAAAPAPGLPPIVKADLFLVTHAHGDHFQPGPLAEAARRTGAIVAGPRTVTARLSDRLTPGQLVELEPEPDPGSRFFPVASAHIARAEVTAFRTYHSRDHTSYLVETPSFRFMHDGDNEDTRRYDIARLGRLDALLIGPWQGADWVTFIDRLKPRHWFMIHLSEDELDQHDAGRLLPDLCDHVPEGLVVLRPGESFQFD